MSIPIKFTDKLFDSLISFRARKIYAQADARHVLQEVDESIKNYPKFDEHLTEKATHAAYSLISCGCSYIENNYDISKGFTVLERAGKLLSDTYRYNKFEQLSRNHNLLISGMSLYAAKQYSRAFIALRDISNEFAVGQIITCFIKKDFSTLITAINQVIFEEPLSTEFDEWAITYEIARCFAIILEFISTGNHNNITLVNEILDKMLVISKLSRLTLYWLIIRLLKIIISTFNDSSLWSIIPPLLPPTDMVNKYINLLSSFRTPVIELWPSQVIALPLALGANNGVVINLRTSGGKTRIAEIAILKTLSENCLSKILFLAPFRSLAFEIEQSFHDVFHPLGYTVTHLYGGATVNVSDSELISLSDIIVATPEKAKALIRCGSDILDSIKLIVVDEGHLLGDNERYIRNEMFISHIKEYASKNSIRILLLSAVLPNANELAQWITGDANLVAKSNWKPSIERFGYLLWDGEKVRLEWKGEIESFNPSFIQKQPLGFGLRRNEFPNNKNEAVAATAVRLSKSGPVMIFSARANSIPGLASEVLLSLGETQEDHPWSNAVWSVFENICVEELEQDSYILLSARKGIICHSNKLTPLVRIAIEQLMRSYPPKIIIASSTLGQGVNVGISTVIVSTPYIDQNPISKRDFWNICGRAGRAFSDSEGKILYAIDRTKKDWQVQKDFNLANDYFNSTNIETVESGILVGLKRILDVSQNAGVEFETLIEMIANDTIQNDKIGEYGYQIQRFFNLLDDELIAMHENTSINEYDTLDWIEKVFKKSLAFIQAKDNSDRLVLLIHARTRGLLKRIPSSVKRKKLVTSGLPLSVSNLVYDNLDIFRNIANAYILNQTLQGLDVAVHSLELWININATSIVEKPPSIESLDNIRALWLSGASLTVIRSLDSNTDYVTSQYYGYSAPWIINAVAQMFDSMIEEQYVKTFTSIALLIELGLPNDTAAYIYMSGIRSRMASVELAQLSMFVGVVYSSIKPVLLDLAFDTSSVTLTPQTQSWLKILSENIKNQRPKRVEFPVFTWKKKNLPLKLYVRELHGKVYLCSYDGSFKEEVQHTDELPFQNIANIFGLYLSLENCEWVLKSNNPNLRTPSSSPIFDFD